MIKIEIKNGNSREIHRNIGTGGSFGAGSLQAEIGLGQAESIEELVITWPDADKSIEIYENLDVNTAYLIVQEQAPKTLNQKPVPFHKEEDLEHVHMHATE
jgi:hypothetical protein